MFMTAKNMAELNKMLMRKLEKAMTVVSEKALESMYEETGRFYTEGETPSMYERTGALGDTPRVTGISSTNKDVSFKAYLDTNHRYKTGKKPTMEDILNLTLANPKHNGSVGYLRSVKGKIGFWERSEEKIDKAFREIIQRFL